MKDIFDAAAEGDIDCLRQILERDPEAVHRHCPYSKDSGSPLLEAVSYNQGKAVCLLLEKGASLAATDYARSTPLHRATFDSHLEILKILIDHKANINAQDHFGDTPLHGTVRNAFSLASQEACLKSAETLIKHGADLCIRNEHGLTPLHLSITKGRTSLARLFAATGIGLQEKTQGGFTPAELARDHGLPELADFIERAEQEAYDRALKRKLDTLDRILKKNKKPGKAP